MERVLSENEIFRGFRGRFEKKALLSMYILKFLQQFLIGPYVVIFSWIW